ncbi:MAG: hypothetical protein ACRECV_20925 [Xanthobacteraceae bacterium]
MTSTHPRTPRRPAAKWFALFYSGQSGAGRAASSGIGRIFARSFSMMDVIMLAIGVGFFALSIAYVYACDQF